MFISLHEILYENAFIGFSLIIFIGSTIYEVASAQHYILWFASPLSEGTWYIDHVRVRSSGTASYH